MLLLLASILLIVCVAYSILAESTAVQTRSVATVYSLTLLAAYGFLWYFIADLFKSQRATPRKAFWHTLVAGVICFGLAFVILHYLPGGFTDEWVAIGPISKVKSALLSLLEAVFFFVLLLRFRDLALYRRTKNAERNWHLMLGFMVAPALMMLIFPLQGDVVVLLVAYVPLVVPALVFMAANALRISWIVQLSFRQKMTTIGLVLLLLAFFGVILIFGGAGDALATIGDPYGLIPGESHYLLEHSPALSLFLALSGVFGFVYCTMTALSLVFHLPTTGDFQRRADEMAVMHSLTDLVTQVFDLEKLVTTITASPVEAGLATASWLATADPHTGSLQPRVIATHNIAPQVVTDGIDTDAFYSDILLARKHVLVDRAMLDRRVRTGSRDGIGSLLVIPLAARNEVLGALFVARSVTHGFEREDIEATAIFAAQAAIALENARLFEEQIERERLSRELAIAREVQHKLLPQRLPTVEGLTIAASSVSAQEVGGDYYDFVELDGERLAVIVGDVSGKGTSAAFYMAEMQGIFQSATHIAPEPAEFLTHANRVLARLLESNTFMTVIYGLLDGKRQQLRIARAGHCPAAFVTAGTEARYLRCRGLGLALDRGALFRRTIEVETINLKPGDVFVLYTDGVVESRNASGEEYGYDRLLTAISRNRGDDASTVHRALLGDLDTFLEIDRQYDDDLTLVVLKWHGQNVHPNRTVPE